MPHLEFSKEITALLVIDPYNEFISAGPPSIDNRTARIRTEQGRCRHSLPNRRPLPQDYFRIARDSGAMHCLHFQASVEIFDQHDVAFEGVNAGVDDRPSIGRDIKAGCGFSRSADVQHTEAGLFVRG